MAGGNAPRGGPQPRRRWRSSPGRRAEPPDRTPLREALQALLERMGGTPERAGLQNLWDNWEAAVGPELAGLAQPLGHRAAGGAPRAGAGRGMTLLLGAADAMLLQELRFRGDEILERVNGYLGRACFCEVKVSLPLGRSAPVRSREQKPKATLEENAARPAARGVFLVGMDSDSPVARCYARFARLAARGGGVALGGAEEKNKK